MLYSEVRPGGTFFKKQGLDRTLPSVPMFDRNKIYKTCGVVSNSGALADSGLGKDIDSNEFVIRLNAAPTKGYERDVGSKTSIRIITFGNIKEEQYKFFSNEIFDCPILLKPNIVTMDSLFEEIWSIYNTTEVIKRCNDIHRPFHVIHPRVGREVTEWLQKYSSYKFKSIQQPSTGFMAIAIAATFCEKVNTYEIVPSFRGRNPSGKYTAHYYDKQLNYSYDVDLSNLPSLSDYLGAMKHPMAMEKMAAMAMNTGSEEDIYLDGKISFPGVPSIKCQEELAD